MTITVNDRVYVENIIDLVTRDDYLYINMYDDLNSEDKDNPSIFIMNKSNYINDIYLLLDAYETKPRFVKTVYSLYDQLIKMILKGSIDIDINKYIGIVHDLNDDGERIKYIGINYRLFDLFGSLLNNDPKVNPILDICRSMYNNVKNIVN